MAWYRVVCCVALLVAVAWAVTPASQISALQDLYVQTSGAGWTTNTNWNSEDPCDNNWYGITCQNAGGQTLVTQISLPSNKLVNTAQLNYTIWSRLTNLTSLELGGNQLSHILGIYCALCTYFDVSYNSFSGSAAEISLPNAQVINVQNNAFTGPLVYILQAKQTLQALTISNNQFSGKIPPDLAVWPSLKAFYASNNQLSGQLPHSFEATSINVLFLDGNQLTGLLPELSPFLSTVDLSGNNFQCPIPYSTALITPAKCTYCPPGNKVVQQNCQMCPAGSMAYGNDSNCYLCPPGSANPLPGQSICSPCPEDFWSPAGALNCYPPKETVDVSDSNAKGALGVSVVVLVFVLVNLAMAVYHSRSSGASSFSSPWSNKATARGNYQSL